MTPCETTNYRYSASRLALLVASGVALTFVSALIAFRVIPVGAGSYQQFVGAFGTAFFFLATCIAMLRFRQLGTNVVTLGASGITDRRLAPEEIPWDGIRQISQVTIQRQRLMILDVAPAVEQTLHLTRRVRWSRSANRRIGIDGLTTSAQGLAVDFDILFGECLQRCELARRR